MIFSEALLAGLVLASLGVTMLTPVLLLILFWRDRRKGTLW